MRMEFGDEFKKPIVPPHSPLRPQDFTLYAGGHPYQLLAQGGSAFHRPLDPSGKPIPVGIFVFFFSFSSINNSNKQIKQKKN